MDRVRDSRVNVVINLTAGMGGRPGAGSGEASPLAKEQTDMASAEERPPCGTDPSGNLQSRLWNNELCEGDTLANTTSMLRDGSPHRDLGVDLNWVLTRDILSLPSS